MNVVMMVADYANVTNDNRVNVLGIFNQIRAIQFPARHHSMWLVAKVSLDIGERAITRPCQIRLLDEDSTSIIDIEGELPFHQTEAGVPPEVNIILPLNNVVFPKPGIYNFTLLVNDRSEGVVPIQVVQTERLKPE